ncbi:uncharacterized protein B0H18DRAFT_302479 [Fomitopsis serialis]|uniref:uncharacterized protein n=1 Tax=Fomitopsis serialis TaxID=139415 RepID=UPI0020085FFA|nr:uncharacterized protein B0H18DRAFT_302479 [Neoantrodia serialis]KAH9926875.1 hypothetical protein B0H18DRAFT_302479 [Neoantrodia serialis]
MSRRTALDAPMPVSIKQTRLTTRSPARRSSHLPTRIPLPQTQSYCGGRRSISVKTLTSHFGTSHQSPREDIHAYFCCSPRTLFTALPTGP